MNTSKNNESHAIQISFRDNDVVSVKSAIISVQASSYIDAISIIMKRFVEEHPNAISAEFCKSDHMVQYLKKLESLPCTLMKDVPVSLFCEIHALCSKCEGNLERLPINDLKIKSS